MKCQKGKRCVKQPGNALPILRGDKVCSGCDKMGKDKPSVDKMAEQITNALMSNNIGNKASILQLRGTNEEDYGGNCRESVFRIIRENLEAGIWENG